MGLFSIRSALFAAKLYEKHSSRKYIDFFCSEFNKIILRCHYPYFELIGGVTQPLIFNQRHNIFSWYYTNHYKINGFCSGGVPTIL